MSSAFILTDNGLFACGANKNYQLGLGHNNDISTPVKVDLENVVEVLRFAVTMFVTSDGDVYCSGNKYDKYVPKLADKTQLTKLDIPPILFKHHRADIKKRNPFIIFNTIDGRYVWGDDTKFMGIDVQLPTKIDSKYDIHEIHTDGIHNVLETSEGIFLSVRSSTNCWYDKTTGTNCSGEHPLNIPKVTSIHMNTSKILFNTIDGLYYFGMTNKGYELDKIAVPHVIEVCYNGSRQILKTTDGIYCQGYDIFGETGLGKSNTRHAITRLNIPEALSVTCGKCCSIYNTIDGIYVCGRNTQKKLLNSKREYISKPTLVKLPKVINIYLEHQFVVYETADNIYIKGRLRAKIKNVATPRSIMTSANYVVIQTPAGVQCLGAIEGIIVGDIFDASPIYDVIIGKSYVILGTADGYYSIGSNQDGELGLGHNIMAAKFTKIPNFDHLPISRPNNTKSAKKKRQAS